MEERVFVESPYGEEADVYPDVRVVEYNRAGATSTLPVTTGEAAAQPVLIEIPKAEISEAFIQIIDTDSGNKVVSAIEFLSPSNKRKGSGQEEYLEKQRKMVEAKVNLVEVDLLRRGQRILLLRPSQIPPKYRTLYQACVWRSSKPKFCAIYAKSLQSPLPTLSVPLRESDDDVKLNLQTLLEQAYRNGRYDSIDYSQEPAPALDADDAAWADSLLKSAGKR